MRGYVGLFAAAILTSAPVVAQETPPRERWVGAGTYCLSGARIVVPDGYEARSLFGYDLELRAVGSRPSVNPAALEITLFDGAADAFEPIPNPGRERVACNPGATYEIAAQQRDAAHLAGAGVFIQRCSGASEPYGEIYAHARLTRGDQERVFSALIAFGSESFFNGVWRYDADGLLTEEAAFELWDAVTADLAACET